MKRIVTVLSLAFSIIGFSQEDITPKVQELKAKISNTEGADKLVLMDSLSRLIGYNGKPEFKFDSITRATIQYAYEQDSIAIAVNRTSDLIFYFANRANRGEEGIKLFKDFEKRNIQIEDNDVLSMLYFNVADAYYRAGILETSISNYKIAENIALKNKDTSLYATARTYRAATLRRMARYAEGSKLLNETVAIFTKQKDTANLMVARNELAAIYTMIGFFKEAQEEREQILTIARSRNDYRSSIPLLYNASANANRQGNRPLSIRYLHEAYQEIEKAEKIEKKKIKYKVTVKKMKKE